MTEDRMMVVRAVQQGQLPTTVLTDNDILTMELELMELIVNDKLAAGKIAFADHCTLQ